MVRQPTFRNRLLVFCCFIITLACFTWLPWASQESKAAPPWRWGGRFTGWSFYGREALHGPQALGGASYYFPDGGSPEGSEYHYSHDGQSLPPGVGGSWYWMRSPEQERVVAASLFNRYCIRCHAVDGRGVWDIPGIPNFTNTPWQASRSDDQIARIIVEGRGAVMPTFRGTLTLEEAWAMARHLRTFVPGSEAPRPDFGNSKKPTPPTKLPAPKMVK